jgi:hypothetical protein
MGGKPILKASARANAPGKVLGVKKGKSLLQAKNPNLEGVRQRKVGLSKNKKNAAAVAAFRTFPKGFGTQGKSVSMNVNAFTESPNHTPAKGVQPLDRLNTLAALTATPVRARVIDNPDSITPKKLDPRAQAIQDEVSPLSKGFPSQCKRRRTAAAMAASLYNHVKPDPKQIPSVSQFPGGPSTAMFSQAATMAPYSDATGKSFPLFALPAMNNSATALSEGMEPAGFELLARASQTTPSKSNQVHQAINQQSIVQDLQHQLTPFTMYSMQPPLNLFANSLAHRPLQNVFDQRQGHAESHLHHTNTNANAMFDSRTTIGLNVAQGGLKQQSFQESLDFIKNLAAKGNTEAFKASGKYLDLLLADIKGRVAALKRSKQRVTKMKAKSYDQFKAPNTNGHAQAAEFLFRDMDSSLAGELVKLERWLKQVMEMKALGNGETAVALVSSAVSLKQA